MNNASLLRRIPYRFIEHFIMNTKKDEFKNKSYTYVIKYDNKIKMGYSNDIHKKFSNHYKILGCAEILRMQRFHSSNESERFVERLAKYNNNQYINNDKNEATILKTYDDLNAGKYKILDKD